MSGIPSNPNGPIPSTDVTRRLAAVAFVDIAGYTILMASDETRTHQRWMRILSDLIRPQAEQHRGKVVKSTGDGVLAEFPSVLDAVEWARDVQRSVTPIQIEHDTAPASIALRIGINFCNLITTDFDIFGAGVNVAARLQEHADAGGIVLSEAAYDLVRGTVDLKVRDLGFLELKNVGKPVKAYAIETEAQKIAVPIAPQERALPSIAVLPLRNLSGDAADDYFADGIVEDIIVSLAGLRELLVISRASTLIYRGREVDPREAGRTFGVRYILMGSVRRSERLVRVSAQLCEVSSGANLWADVTEIAPGELFELQDRIVQRIVSGIAPNVRAEELRRAMRKRPEKFTAYDCTLRALHIINSLDVHSFLQAREYLNKAMAEDPQFAMPVAWAARWHSLYVGQGWSPDPAQDAANAVQLASKAVELDPRNALALATYGHLKSYLFHDYDSAMVYLDRALLASPNQSLAWILSSATLSYVGRGEEAVKHAEHALRLSPFDQNLFYYYMFLCLAYYTIGNYEQALKWGKMSASENPSYTANHRFLIASLAALDRLDEARQVATDLMSREPQFRLGVYERTRQPYRYPEMRESLMRHLRKAGLPE